MRISTEVLSTNEPGTGGWGPPCRVLREARVVRKRLVRKFLCRKALGQNPRFSVASSVRAGTPTRPRFADVSASAAVPATTVVATTGEQRPGES